MNRLGIPGEDMAVAFLEARGLTVLQRNYRCRLGEIDLVARDGAMMVFVEVRKRKSSAFGGAAASITAAKRVKLLKAARHYISRLRTAPPCRFDALLIEGEPPRIEWIRNAFGE
ncbi:MAG TPA: YraN family protein [Burkholderiales bacterium]|nr:YraN family protein [Burkholderiales bacterium]